MTIEANASTAPELQEPAIMIRPSREDDVDAMLAIYLQHFTKGLEPGEETLYETPQKEDIKRRCKNMAKHRLPHLLAEVDGKVVGYAYAVPFRKRPAYRVTLNLNRDRIEVGGP
jgi:L-amino acid N-acyltransferase YncA